MRTEATQRSFNRRTNLSPDQMSVTAQTFTSTSPAARPIRRDVLVIGLTLDAFLGRYPEHASGWKERDRLPEVLLQVRAGGREEQNAIGCPAAWPPSVTPSGRGRNRFRTRSGTLQDEPMPRFHAELRDQRLATVAGQRLKSIR